MITLPFHRIYGFLYKSFSIGSDTVIIQDIKKRKIDEAMVIKRSYVFAIFISWILFATIGLTGLNIYNAYVILGNSISSYFIIGALGISCFYLLLSSIKYIYGFAKTYGSSNVIMPINYIENELKEGNEKFMRFFNQISGNILLFYILIFFNVFHIIYSFLYNKNYDFNAIMYGVFDIMCLIAQIYSMHYYRKRMIDLEMDFNIVIPGKIYFINQSNMLSSQQTLDSEKIKTIKSSMSNWFMSFFNLGSVSILTEGDPGMMGIMDMYYVDNPRETVSNMEVLIKQEIVVVSNPYLLKILQHLDIKDVEYDFPENVVKIRNFLKENDKHVQEDYFKGGLIEKESIESMYKEISLL